MSKREQSEAKRTPEAKAETGGACPWKYAISRHSIPDIGDSVEFESPDGFHNLLHVGMEGGDVVCLWTRPVIERKP